MKFFSLLLLAISLAACMGGNATPAPTAAPSAAPAQPTGVPTPGAPRTPLAPLSASSLDVKDVKQNTQSNQVNTTANITTGQNLGIGQVELSYPETMVVGEARAVSLRLTPTAQLASSTKAPVKTPIPNAGFVYKFSGNIDLYPVMNAQLIALGFDVNPPGSVQHAVDTSAPATWSWIITAKQPGRQELALTISIPAVVDGVNSDLTKPLQDLPLVITVQPQPVSLTDKIMQSIANNSGAIVVALIGLIGTIIGIVVKMRSDKSDSTAHKAKR